MRNTLINQQILLNNFCKIRFSNYASSLVAYYTTEQCKWDQDLENLVQSPANVEVNDFIEAINFLVETIEPEKIFLAPDDNENGERNLIVVVREYDHSTFEEREKLINNPMVKREAITMQVIKGNAFDSDYEANPIYLGVTCNAQTLIYDDGCFALPDLDKTHLSDVKAQTHRQFYKVLERMDTFLASAVIYKNENPAMAAFNLHQAVELGLNSLIKGVTGAVKTTHRLRKLIKASLPCNPEIGGVMSNGEPEDEQMMDLLEEAYLGYRYSNNYKITTACVEELIDKAEKLRTIVESTFLEWLIKYELQILDLDTHE